MTRTTGEIPNMYEYRVIAKRVGGIRTVRRYATLKGAEKRLALLTSDRPWEALGIDPDDRACCSGLECGCGGITKRQQLLDIRANLPALLDAWIERRPIGEWEPTHGGDRG